jgi:hypothetical protein
MTQKFFILIFGLLISAAAQAQDYGVTIGIHQTTATVDSSITAANPNYGTGSVNGTLGFDLGLTASFELVPGFRFRTGALYDTRSFDYKLTGSGRDGQTVGFRYAYIDVPVNAQYNFTPMVGIYGGLIVGIKASDSMNLPNGMTGGSVKSLYPLANVGVNFTFNDMLGFDLYYESGLGEFADKAKNYSTVGAHFIYWL